MLYIFDGNMFLSPRWTIGIYLLCLLSFVELQRTKDKMYISIPGFSCFKRLNGTHETGCTSKFGGSVGVLHVVQSQQDFDFLTTDAPSPPYAVVVTPELFTRANILPLKNNHNVSAIVLIKNHTAPAVFSQELTCPNQYSSYNNASCEASRPQTLWNPDGTGLMHESFPFPIYYIKDQKSIELLTQCFVQHNAHDIADQALRSLCSIEIRQLMSATGNSATCLRRSRYEVNVSPTHYCDPMSGLNTYATLHPRVELGDDETAIEQPDEKFIVVTARQDTTSMFEGLGGGAMEFLPAATLLSTARTLGQLLPEKDASNNSNVLFMLFDGETYDYIGSQRFVYDVEQSAFPSTIQRRHPITVKNIELVVDLGNLDDMSNLNVHHIREFSMATKLLSALEKYNRAFNLSVATTDLIADDMPPTSAQSFLRLNRTFPITVLASKPSNHFLHSIFDGPANVGFRYRNTSQDFMHLMTIHERNSAFEADSVQMAVRNVSTLLAYTLYELVKGKPYSGQETGNVVLCDEILYCFLESINCPLLEAASSSSVAPSSGRHPPNRYTGVHISPNVGMLYRMLGLLLGQRVDLAKEHCSPMPLQWFNGANGTGECRHTTQNTSLAQSPAFIIDDYDFASGQYSTWTESTWSELSARIFLKPSTAHEALTLGLGFATLLILLLITYMLSTRPDILLNLESNSEPNVVGARRTSAEGVPC